jgi:hypothetical protein
MLDSTPTLKADDPPALDRVARETRLLSGIGSSHEPRTRNTDPLNSRERPTWPPSTKSS